MSATKTESVAEFEKFVAAPEVQRCLSRLTPEALEVAQVCFEVGFSAGRVAGARDMGAKLTGVMG